MPGVREVSLEINGAKTFWGTDKKQIDSQLRKPDAACSALEANSLLLACRR